MALGNKRRMAMLVLGTLLLLRLSPMSVYNASLLLVGNSCGWAWQRVRAVPAPTPPLKTAILNVTSDFDQLAHLIGDFLQQPATDPAIEERFKEYLATRAARSYPRLESLLDWLLAVYKFVFPFLIISMAAKRSSGSREQGGEADAGVEGPELELEPSLSTLGRRSSMQQQNGPALARHSEAPLRAAGMHAHQQQHWPPPPSSEGGSSFVSIPKSNGSLVARRAGSQSPQGPETPVEGAAGRLPEYPTLRHNAGKLQQRQQRLATASEIEPTF